jgi:O-acetyl-ADP-ribose deacetylase (regulator of RNase III)
MGEIDIIRGDITKLDVDAIVNAANTTLLGGGGVDGAIHRSAGPELLAECRTLGGCRPGEAKITRGYRLPARFVIHTVGPVWRGGKHHEPETLANCYRSSLQLAVENGIKTIAFPAISCGAYGYPIPEATQIALKSVRDFLTTNDKIDKVTFVLWSDDIYDTYRQSL